MITEHSDGSITFSAFLPDAEGMELLGDFTQWEAHPAPMRRGADGWWTVTLRVGAGDHLFGYRVNGRDWLPDYAAHGIRRGAHGGWVSQLTVPEAPATVFPMPVPRGGGAGRRVRSAA